MIIIISSVHLISVNLTRKEVSQRRITLVEEIKKQVRQAMKILEEGKQVAAFNLFKHIVE